MKNFKVAIGLLALVLTFVSCSDQLSLQEYYVNKAENPNFISFDLPASLLQVADSSMSEQQREAYNSLKKLNVLAFKVNSDNRTDFQEEKAQVNQILKDTRYQELMRLNSGENKGVVKYLGDDDLIQELIIYGANDSLGFALIRVLGKDMKPENMMQLASVIQKGSVDGKGLGQLKGFFQ